MRDQFLTEMMGECWHELDEYHCIKCKEMIYQLNEGHQDFSTPEGFFELWNFCKEQEWWLKFVYNEIFVGYEPHPDDVFKYINPTVFADSIAHYRGWKEGE